MLRPLLCVYRPHPGGPPGMPPQPLFPGGAQPPPRARGPSFSQMPMDGPPKPAFPAYQNLDSTATATCLPDVPVRQASKIPPVGAGCKLIHPEDDLSMVSVCRLLGNLDHTPWKLILYY